MDVFNKKVKHVLELPRGNFLRNSACQGFFCFDGSSPGSPSVHCDTRRITEMRTD